MHACVVLDPTWRDVGKKAADADTDLLAGELRKGIKDYVGVSCVIEVCEPGGVARSEGKAVRVIDERD